MKTYVKPELRFESYELNHSVANCGWELQHGDATVCHATGDSQMVPDYLLGVVYFTENNNGCKVKCEDYCYTNGAINGISLFQS